MKHVAASALLCAITRCAVAQHAGDIVMTLESGSIVTNASAGGVLTPTVVFETELGANGPGFTDDPGFDCAPGTFPAGSRIGFRVHDALRVWNGTDFSEAAIPAMVIAFGSTLSVLTPQTEQTVEGFTLSVGSNGQWHKHYEYTLQAPLNAGAYALEMTLYGTSSLVGESKPFWLIFNQELPASEFEGAVRFARDYFGVACGDLDFNNDEVFPDSSDLVEFIAVFGGATCSTGNCDTIDFNRDMVFPDTADLVAFIGVFGGAPCV